jgi:hypothetical protein
MSALSASKILLKGSNVPSKVPALTSIELRELAVNTADGKLFLKTTEDEVVSFLNSSQLPYVFDQTLNSINIQYGNGFVTGVFGSVLNGNDNNVSGSGSTIVNGEDNEIASDFSFIGSGLNNTITSNGEYGVIVGGKNNTLNHPESFIIGSNITSHLSGFTYVNNLSVLGKIYGDGSGLLGVAGGSGSGDENVNTLVRASSADWSVAGDRYFTTSLTTNSINKGTKVFAVSANLSYIPTQDITIVHDHDASRHMHGTVLDYDSFTGSLTADITSRTGTGSYSDWRINIGGTPTFVDSLVSSNNLSDVADPSVALANLQGISKSEVQSLSASWNYQGTDLKNLSADWQNTFTTVQTNSATWSLIKKFDMVYSPSIISYSGTAPSGSLTSQNVWTITKLTFSNDGSVSNTKVASNVSWNDRLTTTYF